MVCLQLKQQRLQTRRTLPQDALKVLKMARNKL
jgi:hypothetical protein